MGAQGTLLDLRHKDINPYWVDELQSLHVPINPLHAEAHRLQLCLERLDIQLERNPAQFNSTNYLQISDRLTKLWKEINGDTAADDKDRLDSPAVVGDGDEPGAEAEVRENEQSGVDSGVRAEDFSAGSGALPV